MPAGMENWRPADSAMSVADLAHHLIEADDWLVKKLADPATESMLGQAGLFDNIGRDQYEALLSRLEGSGERRVEALRQMTDEDLDDKIDDDRFGGDVSIWWVLVRGNLDHEIHHRGQVATYLRIIDEDS